MQAKLRNFLAYSVLLITTVGFFGCGPNGPRTYPVRGKIDLSRGDVKLLAGSHVEIAHTRDSTIRASGEIQEDGSFRLHTYRDGGILDGAIEGKYQVRIILADDDQASRRRAALTLAARYVDFKSSGLTIDVPTSGEIVLAVAAR